MRIFPEHLNEPRWAPWVWLAFLGLFWAGPIFFAPTAANFLGCAIVTAVFLALYVTGYWVRGRAFFVVVAAIACLGFLFSPWNPGANVFWVYAAAMLANHSNRRWIVLGLAAIVGGVLLQATLTDMSPQAWVPGLFFPLVVSGMSYHSAEQRRTNTALQQAQDEVERLAKLAERERIARDLHDVLGHTLTLVVLKAALAGKLVTADPARATLEIEEIETTARTTLAEVREAIQGYRAESEPRFEAELANARRVLSATGIEFSAEGIEQMVGLEARRARALAFALREAVTNVLRHSGATHCSLRIVRSEGLVEMTIEDDGQGGPVTEGGGLFGMRQRMAALGGSLKWEQEDGIRLLLSLPLTDSEAAEPPSSKPAETAAEAPK